MNIKNSLLSNEVSFSFNSALILGFIIKLTNKAIISTNIFMHLQYLQVLYFQLISKIRKMRYFFLEMSNQFQAEDNVLLFHRNNYFFNK